MHYIMIQPDSEFGFLLRLKCRPKVQLLVDSKQTVPARINLKIFKDRKFGKNECRWFIILDIYYTFVQHPIKLILSLAKLIFGWVLTKTNLASWDQFPQSKAFI